MLGGFSQLGGNMLTGKPAKFDDARLVSRIREAYGKSAATFPGYGASQWELLDQSKKDVHDALLSGNDSDAAQMLRDPASNELFLGFDLIGKVRTEHLSGNQEAMSWEENSIGGVIFHLSSAAGATRINNPEGVDHYPPPQLTSQQHMDELAKVLPFPVDFPNPYENEFGIEINGQVAQLRSVYAMYQAYKTVTVSNITGCKSVMEIGAGLGRSAYYSYKAGIKNYSIIDIPLTCAAQAYFLGRVLGEDKVSLFGEEPKQDAIRILPPAAIGEVACDMTVNVDSLTEMDRSVAEGYIGHALDRSKVLFSINHEVNSFTVNEIIRSKRPDAKVLRNGSPVRAGYMEEIVFIR